MVNIGNPDHALKTAMLPVDGVGLVRLEFIIAECVKIHPMALIQREMVKDENEKREIQILTQNYEKNPRPLSFSLLLESLHQ